MLPKIRGIFATFAMLVTGGVAVADELDWMENLPDDTPLSQITIPGTHNSAALREPFPGTAKCQTLTLTQQLKAGVRFLDIRCRHSGDQFQIFHGPIDQKLSFADCLAELLKFLKAHPSETIVVSIKGESTPKNNTRPFLDTFKSYLKPEHWWIKDTLPTLGLARGKLILLRRFQSKKPLGIPATDWKNNSHHSTKKLVIQDIYQPKDTNTKWQAILKNIASKDRKKLHLNFTSGYLKNRLGIPDIKRVSNPINKRLTGYLATAPHRPHGILVLDFITPELASSIIRLNQAK